MAPYTILIRTVHPFRFSLFGVLVLAACGDNGADRSLTLADRLMNERPDSAYALLCRVAYDGLSSDEQRAYYGVLMGQAKHKNFVALADDSLLAHSALYYRNRDDYNYARAQNYLGLAYEEQSFYDLAIEAYKEASTALSGFDDRKMRALVYSNLGMVYGKQYFTEEAIAEYHKANALFAQIGDTLNWVLQCHQLGSLYSRSQQYDSAYAARGQALALLGENGPATLRAEITEGLAWSYFNNGHPLRAKQLMDSVRWLQGGRIAPEQYNIMAFLMRDLGRPDSAHYYLDHDPTPHHGSCRLRSELYEQEGNYRLALEHYRKFKNRTDSILLYLDSIRVDEIAARYDYTLIATEKERLKSTHRVVVGWGWWWWWWRAECGGGGIAASGGRSVVVAASPPVAGGVWWWRHRRQLRAVWQLVESLKAQAPAPILEVEHSLREARLRRAIEKRLALVGEIISLSYEYRDQGRTLAHKIDALVTRDPLGSEMLNDIFEVVDSGYRGLIEHLRTHYPSLNASELQICALTCVGYTPHQLFLILNAKNVEAIYNKKYYINSKLDSKGDLRDTLFRIVETLR